MSRYAMSIGVHRGRGGAKPPKPAKPRVRSALALTIHRIVVAAATSRIKIATAHCAWCRNSETAERSFTCRKGLPMEAETCSQWRDSRKPSSIYEDHRP